MRKSLATMLVLALLLVTVTQMPMTHSAELPETEMVKTFLKDVALLDVEKYEIELVNVLGGSWLYRLSASGSTIDLPCRFENHVLLSLTLTPIEGSPLFVQPATDALDAAKSFMDSYRAFSQKTYLKPLQDMLNQITEMQYVTVTSGNTTFNIKQSAVVENHILFEWRNDINGIYNGYNQVSVFFRRDGTFVQFSDTWNRYPVGSADAMSEEEAYSIARAAVEAYSYTVAGQTISGLVVSEIYAPPVAELTIQLRKGVLYPRWEFLVPLNQSYPPRVWSIQVILWEDTGEISFITPSGHMGGPDPSPESSPGTSTPAPSESPPPDSSATLPTGVILYASAAVATIVISVVALALKKRKH